MLDFHWDTAGRLRRVKQDTHTRFTAQYTADGERVLKTDDTTGSHVFSFGLHDTANGGTLYTPGLAQRRGTTDSFLHSDWLGSTRYLTDATGLNAPSALRYDAFGNLSASAGAANPTDFQFAGAWGYETEGQNGLGLHYLYQRYYDAAAGRFISRDPIRWAGGLNLYGYAANDPVGGVDPLGLNPLKWYMGGMGGFSNWVDLNLMGGATGRLGTTVGRYDSGLASGWEIAAGSAEWMGRSLMVALPAGGTLRGLNSLVYLRNAKQGYQLALGINKNGMLEAFAKGKGCKTFLHWATDPKVQTHGGIVELVNGASRIQFNLRGMSPTSFLKYLAGKPTGTSNFTNWELKHILTNPRLWNKTNFNF